MTTKEKPEESEEIVTTLPLVPVEEEEPAEDPQETNLPKRRKLNLPQPQLNDRSTLQIYLSFVISLMVCRFVRR